MLNIIDAKTLVSSYKFIEKNVEAMDKYIFNQAINFGPNPDYYTTVDVTNSIVNLMERKNRLINLKLIIDEVIASLPKEARQILILKMRYRLNVNTMCEMLKLSSIRTAFRKTNIAYMCFLDALNKSKYVEKIKKILDGEAWINNIRQDLMERKSSLVLAH